MVSWPELVLRFTTCLLQHIQLFYLSYRGCFPTASHYKAAIIVGFDRCYWRAASTWIDDYMVLLAACLCHWNTSRHLFGQLSWSINFHFPFTKRGYNNCMYRRLPPLFLSQKCSFNFFSLQHLFHIIQLILVQVGPNLAVTRKTQIQKWQSPLQYKITYS